MFRTLAGAFILWRAIKALRRIAAIGVIAGAIALYAIHPTSHSLTGIQRSIGSAAHSAQTALTRLLEQEIKAHPAPGITPPKAPRR